MTSTLDLRFLSRLDPAATASKYNMSGDEELVNFFLRLFLQGDMPEASRKNLLDYLAKAKKQTRITAALTIAAQVGFPDWVEVDDKKFSGILKSVPDRQEILPDINESLVVELYSK